MNILEDHTFAICAYQESPYLEACIRSLLNQTIKSKVILCTSTPNQLIQSLATKYQIPLFCNPNPPGIGSDWNFAVRKSDTTYVTLAHQDDLYHEKFFESFVSDLKKKDFIIRFTNYREILNDQELPPSQIIKLKCFALSWIDLFPKSKWVRKRILSFGDSICCPSVTLNTKVVSEEPFTVGYSSNLDWLAWIEFSSLSGNFLYNKEVLMSHRIHLDSETSKCLKDHKRFEEDYDMFCKFWPKWIAKLFSKITSRILTQQYQVLQNIAKGADNHVKF